MKTLLLICFILSLLGSQAAITNFPGGPLESYKAYMRGVCAAVGVDCDLNSVSSSWDDTSASEALNMMYQSWSEALDSSPNKISAMLKTFFTEGSTSSTASVYHALHSEGESTYARQLYEKLGVFGHGFVGIIRNIIHYASVRPEDSYAILKNMAMLAEQGNFEAVGLLDGNFMVQASALKKKEGTDWRTHAKGNRHLLLKGMCEALGLDCPKRTLNCMNEKDSEADLQLLYEWFRAVATRPAASGHGVSGDFLIGRGKQLMDKISKSAIECDENSEEIKLINEKLGFDIWSLEWAEITVGFMREFPELGWHYKISEYELFDNGDLEGVGILLGLDWYQVAEWRHGRLEKKSPHATIETEDL